MLISCSRLQKRNLFAIFAGNLAAGAALAGGWLLWAHGVQAQAQPEAAAQAQSQGDLQALIGYAVTEISSAKYQDIDRAITRYRNSDFQGALELLEMAKNKNPELPPPEVLLARLQISGGSVAARATLEQAVKKYPNDPEPYVLVADLLLNDAQVKQLSAAELLYQRAASLPLEGNDKRKRFVMVRTYNGLADIAERREDWATAAKHLKAWTDLDPDQASAMQRLGRALFMQNDYKGAYRQFSKAHEKEARLPHQDVTTAQLYALQGKAADAQKFFELAVKNDAKNTRTRTAYVQWLLETEDVEKAQAQAAAALELEPNSADAQFWSGMVARMAKQNDKAEKHLQQAHLLTPANADIINQLTLLLIDQDDKDKQRMAAEYAALGNGLAPNSGEMAATLVWTYYRLGRSREAEQKLSEALQGRTLGADSRYYLAQFLFDQGKNDAALRLLQPALNGHGLFVHRKEAQALLERLNR